MDEIIVQVPVFHWNISTDYWNTAAYALYTETTKDMGRHLYLVEIYCIVSLYKKKNLYGRFIVRNRMTNGNELIRFFLSILINILYTWPRG